MGSVGAALKSQGDGGPAYQEHHDNWQYLRCSGLLNLARASLPPSWDRDISTSLVMAEISAAIYYLLLIIDIVTMCILCRGEPCNHAV